MVVYFLHQTVKVLRSHSFILCREIRQSVGSTLYIICIIVLTLYSLLVLIQTLMHKGDTLLEW